ncbi:AAA family ATPase [Microbacterium aurum]
MKSAFSPTAPISQRDLFAGRTEQMIALIDAVDEAGQHIVLFGERGVGKTSLAAVTSNMLGGSALSVRVNCQNGDTFSTVWKRAFQEISITSQVDSAGFGSNPRQTVQSILVALDLPDELSPDHVRATLTLLARDRAVVVFFDEFDRMQDGAVHGQFADAIKTLSDQGVRATIVIVGVADNVSDLVSEHASVERALAQINMPRMSVGELSLIVTRGLETTEMTIDPSALSRITKLSQGLPHYTHLLAQQAALSAVSEGRDNVEPDDVRGAVVRATERTQESIASLYYSSTYSAREKNIYKEVLLACALAPADDRGFFAATAVRETLSKLLNRKVEIPQFAGHLNAFAGDRGPVLRKFGAQRKFRYRFINPLLQPYVVMRGLEDELIPASMLDE